VGWGRITRTTDGGSHWTEQTSPTLNAIGGVDFVGSNLGIVVGQGGLIARTTNGGAGWITQSSGVTVSLYGVVFSSSSTATAVGDSGTILRSTDAGSTWKSQASGTTNALLSVAFVNDNRGVAVGDLGTILRTEDAGSTWGNQTSGTLLPLFGVFLSDSLAGTAVGDSGIILHTETAGIVSVDDRGRNQLPGLVELEQNYPNPFNPTTTIHFALRGGGHVTLRIFNTLGQEVKLLIDAALEAGHHVVDWDGTDDRDTPLSSGVYVYRLDIAQNGVTEAKYSLAKKMLLLR